MAQVMQVPEPAPSQVAQLASQAVHAPPPLRYILAGHEAMHAPRRRFGLVRVRVRVRVRGRVRVRMRFGLRVRVRVRVRVRIRGRVRVGVRVRVTNLSHGRATE